MRIFSSNRGRFVPTLAIAALVGVVLLPAGSAVAAPLTQTTFSEEDFSGASAPGFLAPAVSDGVNSVCLTAGTNTTATPIAGCGAPAEAIGVLRLTGLAQSQSGGVGSTSSVPISKGLDVSFNSYQWGGTQADGMTLYLAATDPFAPEVPTLLGALGGSLGYSAAGATPGLANGYLGIGLDVYGNYVLPFFEGTGCVDSYPNTPNSISVRGPGNGTQGYCVLSVNQLQSGSLRGSGDRSTASVPVEVIINPSTEIITARENASISVAPGTYAVIVQPRSGALQTYAAPLPSIHNGLLPADLYDPSWVDPVTGYPYKLTFGWTGGNGGQYDYHEVSHGHATTALGATPALEATLSGDTTIAPTRSSTVTIASNLSTTEGSEDESVIATTTFPAGFTPTVAANSGWVCVIAGQQNTCTHTSATTIEPGDDLPSLVLPYTVGAGASSGTIETVVSSVDATSAAASLAVAVAKDATTTSASATQQPGTTGASTVFTAVVDSAAVAASGTVTVTDTRTHTVLCTGTLIAASAGSEATATCTANFPVGATASDIVLEYLGDDSHEGSIATLAAVIIIAAPTAIDISASLGVDGVVTFDVTGLPQEATGTVSYTSSIETLCTVTLPTTSCQRTLPVGTHMFTATYNGDGSFAPSTDSVTFTVLSAAAGGLAITGAAASVAIFLALGLLVAGALILLAWRRRVSWRSTASFG